MAREGGGELVVLDDRGSGSTAERLFLPTEGGVRNPLFLVITAGVFLAAMVGGAGAAGNGPTIGEDLRVASERRSCFLFGPSPSQASFCSSGSTSPSRPCAVDEIWPDRALLRDAHPPDGDTSVLLTAAGFDIRVRRRPSCGPSRLPTEL